MLTQRLRRLARLVTTLPWQYWRSWIHARDHRETFAGVETACLFIGYPRSGHSLIGALLDAHPEMIIAHELGALEYITAGFNKNQIYYLLLENSRSFAEGGRNWSGYSYEVPNQHQGRFTRLRVIGDKHGEGVTLRLQARPWLWDRLEKRLGSNLKLVHIVRNPYDNISTIFNKSHSFNKSHRRGNPLTLDESIHYYFSLCRVVARFEEKAEREQFFELHYEDFVEDPRHHLARLCLFLGVEASRGYLDACAEIVFPTPRKTRYDAPWTAQHEALVEQEMEAFPFLEGYSY